VYDHLPESAPSCRRPARLGRASGSQTGDRCYGLRGQPTSGPDREGARLRRGKTW